MMDIHMSSDNHINDDYWSIQTDLYCNNDHSHNVTYIFNIT